METLVRERVTELLPRIREDAARTEAERRIPTEVLAALLDSGAFALVDREERTARSAERLETVRVVAGACGSTGWVTAQAGAVGWLLDRFGPDAWERLRGDAGADPLVAFSPEPAGRLVPDGDDLVLTGRWTAVTGAAHASWLVLAARLQEPSAPGEVRLVLVRTEDCRLDEPVDSVGLTASGAQDLVATGVAVPSACVVPPGDPTALAPIGAAVAMALVGAAQGALAEHGEQVRARVARSHGGEDVTARDLSPAKVGRAASLLDGAMLVLAAQARPVDDPDAVRREPFEDQLYAIDRAVEAAGLVFGSVRGHALDTDDPVARLWRDVRVGAHHARALIGRLRALGG